MYVPGKISLDKHIVARLDDKTEVGKESTTHHVDILHYILYGEGGGWEEGGRGRRGEAGMLWW